MPEIDHDFHRWRVLFDPAKTSIVDFLQVWNIRTDQGRGRTSGVEYCRFVLKPKQRELIERSEARWRRGRAARWRVPKSRGYGLSSVGTAWLGFERVLRVPGWEYTLIAQDNEAAEEHLDRLADFYSQIPDGVLGHLGIRQVKETRRGFVFLHPGGKKSRVTVKTARKRGLGRGGTNNAVHMTERPHWPDKAKEDLSGILGRCYDVAGNVVLDESTAMGHDEFEEDCLAAEQGRGGGYQLFFIPAHSKDANYLEETDDEVQRLDPVGVEPRYGADEELRVLERVRVHWVKERNADQETARRMARRFLAWRRNRIDGDLKHVNVFHREEPTYLEEAFQGYGRLVFPADIMESHKPVAELAARTERRGILGWARGELTFADSQQGTLMVREFPDPGETYCFGCDLGSGQTVRSGKGGESADWSVMTVKHVLSGRTVAQLRGHVYPRPWAYELLKVAVWYGTARGFVENNLPTVVSHLVNDQDLEVAGVAGSEVLLTTERLMKTDSGPESVKEYGWKTTTKTKPFMASAIIDFMIETGVAPHGATTTPWDRITLSEMLRYCYDERGAMNAESGHDDCVVAEGLALLARRELMEEAGSTRLRRRPFVPAELRPFHDAVLGNPPGMLDEQYVMVRNDDGKAVLMSQRDRERARRKANPWG